MNDGPISRVQHALRETLDQATFDFEWFVGTREGVSIGGAGTGYCDLSVPLVATELVLDVLPDADGDIVTVRGFFAGESLYQRVGGDDPEWVELEVHGVGVTPVAAVHWLTGVVDARPTGPDSFAVEIDLDRAVRYSPAELRDTIRLGLEENHAGLSRLRVPAALSLGETGLVAKLDVEIPGLQDPDPGLSLPPRLVTLELRPTGRRHIELPVADTRMRVQDFIDDLLRDD
ncbi:hypothetical protein [Rhizohabitans arisaemae]|uniref:hypothetical protein n=1 Tax=Rhizohabitans arisaemae TaxID=2720610 RepID=UPI0024B0EA82|nr:hypothetical protein [Rhizohabitans arisaemae]